MQQLLHRIQDKRSCIQIELLSNLNHRRLVSMCLDERFDGIDYLVWRDEHLVLLVNVCVHFHFGCRSVTAFTALDDPTSEREANPTPLYQLIHLRLFFFSLSEGLFART
jgi:hypothetical protein